jgi:hypothetical protein
LEDRIITRTHNNPPSDEQILIERLDTTYADKIALIDKLEKVVTPEAVDNEQQAGEMTDFIKSAKAARKGIEDAHKREKEAFLSLGRIVDGFKNRHASRAKAVEDKALAKLDVYLQRKENERREELRQKAERERQEAQALVEQAEAHANEGIHDTAEELMDIAIDSEFKAERIDHYADTAKASDLAKARGAYGGVASRRTSWVGEIRDVALVDLEKLRPHLALPDLQKAVNAYVRNGGRNLAGVLIEQRATAAVR